MREIFRQASQINRDASINAFIDQIILERPDLAKATFYAPTQGKNSLTVMTADEVFKAPKRPEDGPFLIKEYKLLEHLNGYDLGVNIPAVTCYSEKGGFYGMSRLQGEPLTRDLLESLPLEDQQKIAEDLARFNAKFSKTLTEGDRQHLNLGIGNVLPPLLPEDVTNNIRKPHMQEALGEYYTAALKMAAQYAQSFSIDHEKKRTLMIHSDLHPGNILYDRKNKRLGVIDTGTGRIISVDMGLSPLNHSYSASWMDRHLEAFSKETGTDLTREQISFKKCLYGIRHLGENPAEPKAAEFLKGELRVWQEIQNQLQQQPEIKKTPSIKR